MDQSIKKRRFSKGTPPLETNYPVQVYLPSFMFVIVSWVSFLIKPEVVPGRSVREAETQIIDLFFM